MDQQELPVENQPVFNVPLPVLVLLAAIIAVHFVRQALSPETDYWFVLSMAFIPSRYAGLAGETPGGVVAAITSFFTHTFIHGDKFHLAMNSVWLLVFAPVLCRRLGWMRFLMFFFLAGAAGALLFLILNFGLAAPVVGASGAIAGLMGAVMRFLFNAIDLRMGRLLGKDPAAIPLMDLGTALKDRRVQITTGAFIAVNVLAMLGFGMFGGAESEPSVQAARIAWEAHVGGYLFGLLAFGWFDCASQRTSPTPTEVA